MLYQSRLHLTRYRTRLYCPKWTYMRTVCLFNRLRFPSFSNKCAEHTTFTTWTMTTCILISHYGMAKHFPSLLRALLMEKGRTLAFNCINPFLRFHFRPSGTFGRSFSGAAIRESNARWAGGDHGVEAGAACSKDWWQSHGNIACRLTGDGEDHCCRQARQVRIVLLLSTLFFARGNCWSICFKTKQTEVQPTEVLLLNRSRDVAISDLWQFCFFWTFSGIVP